MKPFAVIAYCSHVDDHMIRSMESFRKIGKTEPIIMGQDRNPFSYGKKLRCLYELAKSGQYETLISVDAWDTCATRPISELYEEFRYHNLSMVVGAETNCFPNAALESSFPEVSTRYRFVNAGCWMADSRYFVEFGNRFGIPSLPDKPIGAADDQALLTAAYLNYFTSRQELEMPLDLDTHARYFHNLFGAEDDWQVRNIYGDTLTYRVVSTESTPVIAHGNGKSNITRVMEAMGV
jgi:hypothetical protein